MPSKRISFVQNIFKKMQGCDVVLQIFPFCHKYVGCMLPGKFYGKNPQISRLFTIQPLVPFPVLQEKDPLEFVWAPRIQSYLQLCSSDYASLVQHVS